MTIKTLAIPDRVPPRTALVGTLLLLLWPGAHLSLAVTVAPGETQTCGSWSDTVFGPADRADAASFLELTFQDVPEGITRGRSWRGTSYQLGEKTYAHGIAFNSTKHLRVHLAAPGREFRAEVGLENNDDTRRGETLGQGSVAFHVLLDGKEVIVTPVLRRKDGPVPLSVALHGAREFEVRVTDGGDGRGWDQALWAEATVLLENGTRLRLQDLPLASPDENPFGISFLYRGTNSAALMKHWRRTAQATEGTNFTGRTVTYLDADTGLEVRLEAKQFRDFPAVEWVAYFRNTSATNTPLLESIQALDAVLPVPAAGPPTLHWSRGAVASFDDFAPQEKRMAPGARLRLEPGGGRSSSDVLPFFNLEGANGGVIVAIGWTGEWAAEFVARGNGGVNLKAGLEHTRLVLYPGESIRTPRMLLLFYEGGQWRGQNLWRQFVLAHHRPAHKGQPLVAPVTCGNWGGTRAEVHLANIRDIVRHDLPIQYYWIDAEWFGRGGWPVNVGNWEVKKQLYPEGFKPLSDALRASGRELMLWFEPERVYKGTPWHKEHAEWLIDIGADSLLLNLGNPSARKFLTDFIASKIQEFGLGCYRQDFNFAPLPYWRAADPPDRQGITEIRYIEGLYAFWDDLLARCPGLIIDNCASGGRRLDLETLGRATPFWRTDGPRDAVAHQCHTWGLLPWVPLNATSQDRANDPYEFRSSMSSALCLNWWVAGDVPAERIPDNFPFAWAKATLEQYLKYQLFYYGDYYPLTAYSQAGDAWIGYQLDRPDLHQGMVLLLRRPGSPYESARFPLHGLDPQASYQFTDLDSQDAHLFKGGELTEKGLAVKIAARPGSALLRYQAVPP